MVKPHLVFTPSVRLGLAALAVALVACEPTPNYPVPEQPVVGVIVDEHSQVVTADAQTIVLHTKQADLSVVAGAYPVGTRVTLRLVGNLGMQPAAGTGFLTYPVEAVQLLPAQPGPAKDLQFVFRAGPDAGAYAIFHAIEGDAAWTSTGIVAQATSAGLPFSASAPGLWMARAATSGSTGGSPDGGRD